MREYTLTLKNNKSGKRDRLFCASHSEAIDHAIDHARIGEWKPTGISVYSDGKFLHVLNGNHDLDRLIEGHLTDEANAESFKAAIAVMEDLPGYGSF